MRSTEPTVRPVQRPTTEIARAEGLTARRPAARATGRPQGAPAPVILERYRLVRRLGSGGFGTVWMASDEHLDRDVAIKILPRERIRSGRFEREARATARLAHPGIVTLYEAAVDDEGAYLVSELVVGSTFGDLLVEGRLSDRDIVAIGIALCDALAHAHAQGVIHRDVKPSNVLIPERPETPAQLAKLTDFGVARVIGGDAITRTGDVVGTDAYMAPEQAEGRPAVASADIYSLALVIYEALTGVNPIRTGTSAQRARRLGAHLPPLRRQRRDLPGTLGQGIDRALRPRAGERGSLDELRDALAGAAEGVADRPGVVEPAWRPRGRRAAYPSAPSASRAAASAYQPAEPPPQPPGATSADEDAAEGQATNSPGARILALVAGAVGAGLLAAWITAHLLTPSPVAPGVVGIAGAVAVAVLPRLGWATLGLACAAAAAVQGQAGIALAILIGAVTPVILLPRRPRAWSLAAFAPLLGAIGFAGAWPAVAGTAGRTWHRAALAATGWLWLVLVAPLTGTALYVRTPFPAATIWMPSLYETTHHVLGPLLSSGALAGALAWGLAAAALPWIVRGRSLAVDLVAAGAWAAATVLATSAILRAAHGSGGAAHLRNALAGAIAAAVVALVPSVRARHSAPWNSADSGARFP